MTRQYETVFIMTPVLSEKQIGETVKKYTAILKSGGAEIVHEGSWGLKKLAYPVQKKSTGFYHCVEFTGGSDTIPAMEVAFKRDERILRSLTVSLDKHAVAFNIKDRAKAKDRAVNPPVTEKTEEKKPSVAAKEEPKKEKAPAEETKAEATSEAPAKEEASAKVEAPAAAETKEVEAKPEVSAKETTEVTEVTKEENKEIEAESTEEEAKTEA